MKDLTIKEIQTGIDNWAKQFKKPYFEPLSMLACLTEEVGEVARVMNNMYGDKNRKDGEQIHNLSEELADVISSVIFIANANQIDLSEALDKEFEKMNIRDNNRWEKKD